MKCKSWASLLMCVLSAVIILGTFTRHRILTAAFSRLPRCHLHMSDTFQQQSFCPSKHICVAGAGFAGWAATKSLLEAGCKVTLLDAGDDPVGALGSFTPTGKPWDAGIKGFWKDYPNIYNLIDNELGLGQDSVFTKCTNSSFYSPFGLEATAPVFGDSPILPSPLGQIRASLALFERLPIIDRVSVAGLLLAILDLNQETMMAYDSITAMQLFHRFGLSKRLVDDFLRPTLLVGLFKPPEELSAAVVMELLYFYALAHQTSFDVKWIKKGSVASTIFLPLHLHLKSKYNGTYEVIPNAALKTVSLSADSADTIKKQQVTSISYLQFDRSTNTTSIQHMNHISGVVLAVGSKGLRSILSTSPQLAEASPELTQASTIGSIDCISVRLWLDKKYSTRSPANVFANFDCLRGAGGTFFMLDQLQPDECFLWNDPTTSEPFDGSTQHQRGSVIACDFYNSAALMPLSDTAIIEMLTDNLLPSVIPVFKGTRDVHGVKVLDSYVKRYPGAVNHFAPNTFKLRPRVQPSERISNLVCAGDWVWMGEKEPRSKGLCQERAFVSGAEAALALTRQLGMDVTSIKPVLEVRPDELQVEIGKKLSQFITDLVFKRSPLPFVSDVVGKLLWPNR